jgi:glucose-1-phosphate adenylyltransferase
VRVEAGSTLEFSVIHSGVNIGFGARIRRAMIDKYVNIPPGTCIGCDPDDDRRRGFVMTPAGITVVPKRYAFEP